MKRCLSNLECCQSATTSPFSKGSLFYLELLPEIFLKGKTLNPHFPLLLRFIHTSWLIGSEEYKPHQLFTSPRNYRCNISLYSFTHRVRGGLGKQILRHCRRWVAHSFVNIFLRLETGSHLSFLFLWLPWFLINHLFFVMINSPPFHSGPARKLPRSSSFSEMTVSWNTGGHMTIKKFWTLC